MHKAAWKAAAAAARREGGRGGKAVCVICIGPVVAPVKLPCGHAYCGACLAELRSKDISQTCPQCREELPAGVEGLWDLAFRAYRRVEGMVERGEASWGTLPPAEQEGMDEAGGSGGGRRGGRCRVRSGGRWTGWWRC